jgi:hypothetical protein
MTNKAYVEECPRQATNCAPSENKNVRFELHELKPLASAFDSLVK